VHQHHEVAVSACPDYVWAVLTDVARWPEWAPTLREVVPYDGGPLIVGGGVRVCARNLPVREWRVAEVRPHRGFTWREVGLGSTARLGVVIAPEPPGTRVGFTHESSGWLGAVVGRVTGANRPVHVRELADALRRRCEAGQRAPGRPVAERTRRTP
jgi:polyketide cyclase/dehydrase/lipid transport protein